MSWYEKYNIVLN
ncbi:S-S bond formation pathway protein, partial [Monkeypox virus]